ncbi:MAG: class I SAM-dependent methyltransferase [Methylocella sp.]
MHSGKTVIALMVLAKLLLIVSVLVLLKLGAGYLDAGTLVLVLHGVVLAAIVAFAFVGRARHNVLFGSSKYRAGNHSKGIVLHRAARYDLLARLLTFGREGRFRELMLSSAKFQLGESVLDVACGTGTLAIAAKRQAGSTGAVTGLDASAEMIERARAKAESAGLDIAFVNGTAQELPFDDAQFDIVMGTLMLHHLSKPARTAFTREAQRVLKPEGRLLLIDFGRPLRKSRLPRLHRHGHVDMEAVGSMLTENGFEVIDTGDVGTKNLHYVRAVQAHTD